MQAVMLAAGMGKRLGKYTKESTKCMVPVNGKPLIDYTMESLVFAGIRKLILVIGYRGEKLKKYLTGKYPEIEIEYVENPIYSTTNNIYSLFLACDKLTQDDSILLESDLIYEHTILTELLQNQNKNIALVSPFEAWMDGTVALINDNNEIIGLLDKEQFQWDDISKYYKTVNIYKFSKEFSINYYVPFLEAYQKAFGKNEYYEQALKVLAFLDSSNLKAHIVSGDRWYEIDNASDLAIAETRFASKKDKLLLVQKRYGGYWRFPSMIDFCYLINPYFPPKKLINELSSSLEPLLTRYPSGDAEQSILASKIFNVTSDYLAVGNGAAELISVLADNVTGNAVIPYPTFNEYPERFLKAKIIPIQSSDRSFTYCVSDILETVKTTQSKTVLLINPDNPTGHFLNRELIFELLNELARISTTLIFDESFIDFTDQDVRYTLLSDSILEKYPNLVVIKSISKSYGVPGLRLGIIASGNVEYIKQIRKKTSIWNINSFAEYFLQIFDKYQKTYTSACNEVAAERRRFYNLLSHISGITVFPSQANYLLCKLKAPLTSENLSMILLDKYNILIKDLSSKHGFEDGQYIRLAVRNEHDNDLLLSALQTIVHNPEAENA